MKIDVMSPVWRAWMVKDQWSATHASVVAWAASLSQELTYEWNYEAGEDWLAFSQGNNGLGFMSAKLPLLLCTRALAVRPWPDPLTVVEVPDLHERILTCDMDVLEKCFERKIDRTVLDPQAFSASDLWFCTF